MVKTSTLTEAGGCDVWTDYHTIEYFFNLLNVYEKQKINDMLFFIPRRI